MSTDLTIFPARAVDEKMANADFSTMSEEELVSFLADVLPALKESSAHEFGVNFSKAASGVASLVSKTYFDKETHHMGHAVRVTETQLWTPAHVYDVCKQCVTLGYQVFLKTSVSEINLSYAFGTSPKFLSNAFDSAVLEMVASDFSALGMTVLKTSSLPYGTCTMDGKTIGEYQVSALLFNGFHNLKTEFGMSGLPLIDQRGRCVGLNIGVRKSDRQPIYVSASTLRLAAMEASSVFNMEFHKARSKRTHRKAAARAMQDPAYRSKLGQQKWKRMSELEREAYWEAKREGKTEYLTAFWDDALGTIDSQATDDVSQIDDDLFDEEGFVNAWYEDDDELYRMEIDTVSMTHRVFREYDDGEERDFTVADDPDDDRNYDEEADESYQDRLARRTLQGAVYKIEKHSVSLDIICRLLDRYGCCTHRGETPIPGQEGYEGPEELEWPVPDAVLYETSDEGTSSPYSWAEVEFILHEAEMDYHAGLNPFNVGREAQVEALHPLDDVDDFFDVGYGDRPLLTFTSSGPQQFAFCETDKARCLMAIEAMRGTKVFGWDGSLQILSRPGEWLTVGDDHYWRMHPYRAVEPKILAYGDDSIEFHSNSVPMPPAQPTQLPTMYVLPFVGYMEECLDRFITERGNEVAYVKDNQKVNIKAYPTMPVTSEGLTRAHRRFVYKVGSGVMYFATVDKQTAYRSGMRVQVDKLDPPNYYLRFTHVNSVFQSAPLTSPPQLFDPRKAAEFLMAPPTESLQAGRIYCVTDLWSSSPVERETKPLKEAFAEAKASNQRLKMEATAKVMAEQHARDMEANIVTEVRGDVAPTLVLAGPPVLPQRSLAELAEVALVPTSNRRKRRSRRSPASDPEDDDIEEHTKGIKAIKDASKIVTARKDLVAELNAVMAGGIEIELAPLEEVEDKRDVVFRQMFIDLQTEEIRSAFAKSLQDSLDVEIGTRMLGEDYAMMQIEFLNNARYHTVCLDYNSEEHNIMSSHEQGPQVEEEKRPEPIVHVLPFKLKQKHVLVPAKPELLPKKTVTWGEAAKEDGKELPVVVTRTAAVLKEIDEVDFDKMTPEEREAMLEKLKAAQAANKVKAQNMQKKALIARAAMLEDQEESKALLSTIIESSKAKALKDQAKQINVTVSNVTKTIADNRKAKNTAEQELQRRIRIEDFKVAIAEVKQKLMTGTKRYTPEKLPPMADLPFEVRSKMPEKDQEEAQYKQHLATLNKLLAVKIEFDARQKKMQIAKQGEQDAIKAAMKKKQDLEQEVAQLMAEMTGDDVDSSTQDFH